MNDTTEITEAKLRQACDQIVERAAEMMVGAGAAPEMAMDRLLTYCAAQAASWHGSAEAAAIFRQLADTIEGGIFAHLDRTAAHRRQ